MRGKEESVRMSGWCSVWLKKDTQGYISWVRIGNTWEEAETWIRHRWTLIKAQGYNGAQSQNKIKQVRVSQAGVFCGRQVPARVKGKVYKMLD